MTKNNIQYSLNEYDLAQILSLINCLSDALREKITETSKTDYCGSSEREYWEEISKVYSGSDFLDLKEIF